MPKTQPLIFIALTFAITVNAFAQADPARAEYNPKEGVFLSESYKERVTARSTFEEDKRRHDDFTADMERMVMEVRASIAAKENTRQGRNE